MILRKEKGGWEMKSLSYRPPYGWHNYAIDFAVCGADFIFLHFSGFFEKIIIIKSRDSHFHHIGAEWYKIHEYIYIIPSPCI